MYLSIVPTFAEDISIFIIDYLYCFSGTKLAPNYSPTSPTIITSSCTSATTFASVLIYITTDV